MGLPEGAIYVPDFASEAEAGALLSAADAAPWRDDLKRRVQHYGYRYDYRARSVSPQDFLGAPPGWLDAMRDRLVAGGWFARRPDQVIVNEYQPGQGVAPHVDCVPCFGDVIASLSTGSGCEMAFRALDGEERSAVYLAPGALLVMTGAARHRWTHGIAPRKFDLIAGRRVPRGRRLSFTFRTVTLND